MGKYRSAQETQELVDLILNIRYPFGRENLLKGDYVNVQELAVAILDHFENKLD